MFHGVVTFDFTSVTLIKDAFGNKLPVPFILNFVIAILALIKAVATLNIDNLARPSKQLLLSLIPFLISCTFFKLGAIAMLFGYLSIYAIILVTLILMVGFYINDCTLEDQEHIPRWLISVTNLFKREASEAAEGCLASVAAKLVKTAAKIILLIHVRGNKSAAAEFGPKTGKFGAKLLRLKFQHTCAWNKSAAAKFGP